LNDEVWGTDVEHPVVRRLLAYIVDYLVYAAFGGVLTYILYQTDTYDFARLLGILLTATTIYFTWGASKYSNGQTLGKKVFRIQVVDEAGIHISMLRAFMRSILITLATSSLSVLLLLRTYYGASDTTVLVFESLLLTFIIGVLYFGTVKLNRQCIHDLLLSTQVTEKQSLVTTEKRLTFKLLVGYLTLTIVVLVRVWVGCHYTEQPPTIARSHCRVFN